MRILCIFLRHGTSHYPGSFERLVAWYHNCLPEVNVEFAVVDNAVPDSDRAREDGVFPGDNSCGEFSGFEYFLNRHRGQVQRADLVHFVTSAYEQNYSRYLEHVELPALRYAVASSTCVGHIDSYDSAIHLNGSRSRHWIRTCFLFLSPLNLAKIRTWNNAPREEHVFAADRTFHADCPLDAHYIRQISDWLDGRPQQGVIYHSPRLESSEFRRKTMAILREHSLAIEMRRCGLWLLDFAFAHCLLEEGKSLANHHSTSWESQIAIRTRWLQHNPPEKGASPLPVLRLNTDLCFGSEAGPHTCCRFGWSAPEPGFSWSIGKAAVLRWRLAKPDANLVLIVHAAAHAPRGTSQQVSVFANGNSIGVWHVFEVPSDFSAVIPYQTTASDELTLRFEMPDASSPSNLGTNGDSRVLGIRIFRLRIEEQQCSQPSEGLEA